MGDQSHLNRPQGDSTDAGNHATGLEGTDRSHHPHFMEDLEVEAQSCWVKRRRGSVDP